ncbi:MAG: hypothetical protein K2X81_26515, partial [Candidatus Obscuribacterales bacterium]|nr:hypothetical protein [Candidatus Obscuribacterales bacterium]
MIVVRESCRDEWQLVADITKAANSQYAAAMDKNFWQDYEESTREKLLTETDILRLLALEGETIVGSVIYCPPYEIELAGKL